MKKVTILSLHLGYGGIEKAIADLANNIVSKYDVEILSVYKLYDKSPQTFNSKIKINYLMDGSIALKTSVYKKCLRRFKFIQLFKELFKDYKFNIFKLIKDTFLSITNVINKRRYVKKYLKSSSSDIVISTRDYLNKILGKYGNKDVTKIGWEHNHHNNNSKYFAKIINSVKNLDYFVLVSNELYNDYNEVLRNSNCKCVYIPNMIDTKSDARSKLDTNNLITVSRLSEEKGLFDLVDVIEKVKIKIPNVKLNLIGDGDLYKGLEQYINNKSLSKNIKLLGYKKTEEVHKYICESSLYVMTSFTESFGIVLLESFLHGVPAIAFDSANGARTLIKDNINGLLISNRDKDEMANQIIKLLNDKKQLTNLGKESLKSINDYLPKNVIPLWNNILQ